ncbi:ABC transporter permease [Plantactinospora sp. ZYX-F-223]|uniref:ABC transporter permease n=1 Tax=Plantactinospora sp. ZYX-F-223 TaxID=3144103 RepID=UPI0031FCDBF2
MSIGDLLNEAISSVVARPARTFLTTLGTVLGIGAFVAVLGITATASGQISERFTMLAATEVIVEDVGGLDWAPDENSFSSDADERAQQLPGVENAGVSWQVAPDEGIPVSGVPLPGLQSDTDVPVVAASPGLLRAIRPKIAQGRTYDRVLDARQERVVVLGSTAARRLNITDLRLRPAIFIDDMPFTVVGILGNVVRQPDLLFSALVPRRTAELLWGASIKAPARMLVDTRVGAAPTVAASIAVALRPDAPGAFKVTAPPDPRQLRDQVSTDLNALFLGLAAVCLIIGAAGIANTTMTAVLERYTEIGLRRTLGARAFHIAAQFLTECALLGIVGGLAGASIGVIAVVGASAAQHWTPIIAPWTVLTAPAVGVLVGLLAGVYPAVRAARIVPAEALRR